MPEGRWVATCPSCSKRYSKHRKPKAPTGGRFYYCPPCWKGLSYLPKAERAKLSELTFVDTVSPVVATMPQKRVSAPVSASQAAPSVSVPASAASAPKTFSAPEVAAAMGVPAKNFRAWLRKRSEEHTSELQSLMRISYAVFCLKKKTHTTNIR